MRKQSKEIIKLLNPYLDKFWDISSSKVKLVDKEFNSENGSPVITINGKYSGCGWTEWTQGFQFGIPLLIYEATGNKEMLEIGMKNTMEKMVPHLSHFGVHDHGFNTVSTYGNLLRLGNTGKLDCSSSDMELYRTAIKISGAVQAQRWTPLDGKGGYIYSFNGPHSLFVDTIRSCRVLFLANQLKHRALSEGDLEVDLEARAIQHAMTTAKFSIYYGENRDRYDVWGRVAHESIFNIKNGIYRCPNSQQGFSAFTTWTRGLSWAMLGFSEILEYLKGRASLLPDREKTVEAMLKAAKATSDFYIENSTKDGIPFWDTGAPQIHKLGDYRNSVSNPNNRYEPVDSSAAAIAAQGMIRLGSYLMDTDHELSDKYFSAGVNVLKTLLQKPYLASGENHHGILLNSVYHWPNGWDYVPSMDEVPNGESSMWGDYHLAEACLLVHSILKGTYYTFFNSIK